MNKKKRIFPKSFHHTHDTPSIVKRLRAGGRQSYLRDVVYGAIDGSVTTFAVVAGVVGAGLSSQTIVVLGIANLLADGFSMAAGNYLGTKTENEEFDLLLEFEDFHIQSDPEGEVNEVRNVLKEYGFSGNLLEQNIEFYTQDKDRWIKFMIQNEYNISGLPRSAYKAALATFASFFLCGSLPLLSYLFSLENPFLYSSVLTGVSFLLVGSLKSRWTVEKAYVSALKTLGIGGLASAIAYLSGYAVDAYIL